MTSEFTVSIPKGTKIEGSTSKEMSRYAIGGVQVSPSKQPNRAWLTATDGRQLAALSVASDGRVDTCIVPPESVKAASSITVNGSVRSVKGSKRKPRVEEYPLDDDAKFPPCADVMPDPDDADGYHWALLNPKLLRAMLDSIAPDGGNVAIGIGTDPHKPIVAVGFESKEAESPIGLGVLMPCNTGAPHKDDPDEHKAAGRAILSGQYRTIRNRYRDDATA